MNLAVAATVAGRGLPAHIQSERAELAKVSKHTLGSHTHTLSLSPPLSSRGARAERETGSQCLSCSASVEGRACTHQAARGCGPLTDPAPTGAALIDERPRDLSWLGVDHRV